MLTMSFDLRDPMWYDPNEREIRDPVTECFERAEIERKCEHCEVCGGLIGDLGKFGARIKGYDSDNGWVCEYCMADAMEAANKYLEPFFIETLKDIVNEWKEWEAE